MTAIEFPPMQKGASFNLDAVKAKIEAAARQWVGSRVASTDLWRARRVPVRPLVHRKGTHHETDCSVFLSSIARNHAFPFAGHFSPCSRLALVATIARSHRHNAIRCRPGTTARPNQSILDFVAGVTTQGGPFFVPVEQRIATFDNDGTLWIEQPMYVQWSSPSTA